MTGPEVVLALDIGGTKMAGGLVDPDGELLFARAARTPHTSDPEEVFAVLAGLATEALAAAGRARALACGVGCGGPMLPGGTEVSPLNIPAWRGFPLLGRLEQLTGLPTVVDNDAKALALGEGWRGVARGRSTYLAMVVSTGVGGGVVVDGRLLDGDNCNAGHIGHLIVEPDGRTCVCGAQGCLEAEVSGPSIAAATGLPPGAGHAGDRRAQRDPGGAGGGLGGEPPRPPPRRSGGLRGARLRGALLPGGPGGDRAPSLPRVRPRMPDRAERARRGRPPRGCRRGGPAPEPALMPTWAALLAVARRPFLWPTAARMGLGLVPHGWWRSWPPLPLPPRDYIRFRTQTMFGKPSSGSPASRLGPDDLVSYLEWCRRTHSSGR
ncbi:MAG: ROK family protein [Acidimicrobiales bacterium]